MCRRCLRSFDDDNTIDQDYASSIACTEDGDDASLNELLQRSNSSQNIYRSTSVNQVIRKFLIKIFFMLNKF